MAATTYTWNTIASTQTNGDSPLDETLMEGVRQNQITNAEWIGASYVKEKDHDHDGVNSKTVVLGADSVALVKLNAGISQSVVTITEISSVSGAGVYTDIYHIHVYIPSGAATLEINGDFYDSGAADHQIRIDSPTSSNFPTNLTGSYVNYTLPALDVSADSGWTTIQVMGRNGSGTGIQFSRAVSYVLK